MKHFKQYLEAVKKKSNITNSDIEKVKKKSNITISDVDGNDLKKAKDKDLLNSYGFKTEPWEKEGKWIWPKNVKTRWFNADYKEGDDANFQPEYWMPILNKVFNDDQRKEYGIFEQQLFNYEKPYKLIGVYDASKRGQAPGRNVAGRTGKKVTWLKNLSEQNIKTLKGYKQEEIQKLTHKTGDAVLTFYGSPQDLLDIIKRL